MPNPEASNSNQTGSTSGQAIGGGIASLNPFQDLEDMPNFEDHVAEMQGKEKQGEQALKSLIESSPVVNEFVRADGHITKSGPHNGEYSVSDSAKDKAKSFALQVRLNLIDDEGIGAFLKRTGEKAIDSKQKAQEVLDRIDHSDIMFDGEAKTPKDVEHERKLAGFLLDGLNPDRNDRIGLQFGLNQDRFHHPEKVDSEAILKLSQRSIADSRFKMIRLIQPLRDSDGHHETKRSEWRRAAKDLEIAIYGEEQSKQLDELLDAMAAAKTVKIDGVSRDWVAEHGIPSIPRRHITELYLDSDGEPRRERHSLDDYDSNFELRQHTRGRDYGWWDFGHSELPNFTDASHGQSTTEQIRQIRQEVGQYSHEEAANALAELGGARMSPKGMMSMEYIEEGPSEIRREILEQRINELNKAEEAAAQQKQEAKERQQLAEAISILDNGGSLGIGELQILFDNKFDDDSSAISARQKLGIKEEVIKQLLGN